MASIRFECVLEQFGSQGEKTGWTFFRLAAELAGQLQPGVRTSYRVKGQINSLKIAGVALVPMGEGDFIIAVNAAMRKALRKKKGDKVSVQLSVDHAVFEVPGYITECLADEPEALRQFEKMPPSHQRYYVRWVEEAKTDATRAKRLAMMLDGLPRGWDYGQMLRAAKERKEKEGF
jgi:hypothetical protein